MKKALLLLVAGFAFFIVIFLVSGSNSLIVLLGSYGVPHSTGSFSTGGNAGIISFNDAPPGYSGAQVAGYGTTEVTLTGIFWSQTTGWATFGASPVILIPPALGENARNPWYLSGYAWSPTIGWIALNHGESYASGVAFIPDTASLVGYGWNPHVGWLPFGTFFGTGIDIDINEAFIGKVDIDGYIGGSKTFDVLYRAGEAFNTATVTNLINLIRKNITIMQRNAGSSINTVLDGSYDSLNNAMLVRIDSNPSNQFLRLSDVSLDFNTPPGLRSLIVIGADIFINTDLNQSVSDSSRAIIALKNQNGEGGNIWIRGEVKTIYSTLIAERTIYSGDEFLPGTLSPYFVSKKSLFLDIPRTQLYIKGSIGSYNTIGGSTKDGGAVCPYIPTPSAPCTYDNAIQYDWNYFRIFDRTPANRAYPNDSKDDFSVIIDYDPQLIQDPPPGLESLN